MTDSTTGDANISLVYDTGIDRQIISKLEQQIGCTQVYTQQQFSVLKESNTKDTAHYANNADKSSILKLDVDPEYSYRLSLVSNNNHELSICVNFNSAAFVYRLQHSNTIKQPLARAMGLKKGLRPTILDATAGMGRDGFILASLGCKIIYIERSVIIHALLQDGLRRAAHKQASILENISLVLGDSVAYLKKQNATPLEVIYLDPMYPDRSKQALVKKEMRMLRQVVGKDDNIVELFNAAIGSGAKRVVVKRPKGAERVSQTKPSFDISGKTTRYDVYINP